jgi:hypothetical protein
MTTVLRANTDLVAIAWIGSIPGLSTGMVGSTLPGDTSTWADNGFVEVLAANTAPALNYRLRKPVVTAHCWAVKPTSAKPPWGKATNLAETILNAVYDEATIRRTLTLPVAGYPQARLLEARAAGDVRRGYGDTGNYAHVLLDIEMDWIELP